jgi:hypothetical protein
MDQSPKHKEWHFNPYKKREGLYDIMKEIIKEKLDKSDITIKTCGQWKMP